MFKVYNLSYYCKKMLSIALFLSVIRIICSSRNSQPQLAETNEVLLYIMYKQ